MITPLRTAAAALPALILVVTENDWSARAVETIFDPASFVTLRAGSMVQAVQLARNARPDMVVLLGDPADTGFVDACRVLLQATGVSASCAVIVLAPHPTARQERLEMQRLGVWAVIDEPFDTESLALLGERLVSSRRELRRLEELVLIDSETGIYNERGLMYRAQELGAHAARYHQSFAAIALRPLIDGEPITEANARIAVTSLARHFATVLRSTVRSSDVLGRMGGREFCVIASPIPEQRAVYLGERLRLALEAAPLVSGGAIRRPSAVAAIAAVSDLAHAAGSPTSLIARALSFVRDDSLSGHSPGARVVDTTSLQDL